ncbi:MAG: HNH endonuclease [Alphaproteobacteria bacterium]|nr:HNH endonuclease [Alphaproteobacteria bacterium]
MTDTLLLNADFTPLKVLSWQRAITLMMDEKVGLVVQYADRQVRSARLELPWPAVVALNRYTPFRPRLSYGRMQVIARDRASCQYCGEQPRSRTGRLALDALTVDHVVPRVQAVGGEVVLPWSGMRVPVSCWENVVTACAGCNRVKGGRTPEQAGMRLRSIPRRPSPSDALRLLFARVSIPEEWRDFIPEGVG